MVIVNQQNSTNFGYWAYLAIAKHANKFQKYEKKVLKDNHPEDLHQMRVGMRRLRSAMTGFSLGLELPENATEKKVGKIAKILGELRDLDVLLDNLCNQYLPDLPKSEHQKLQQVLNKLSQKRKEVVRKVRATLTSNQYYQLKKSLQEWLDKPQYQKIAHLKIKSILPDLLLPEISKLFLHSGWLVGSKLSEDGNYIQESLTKEKLGLILQEKGQKLHDLRKEAKKTRYQMELFSQFYGEEYQRYLTDIKTMQTVLGNIQDIVVLKENLTKIIKENIKTKMPFFHNLLQNNLSYQWRKWQSLQIKLGHDDYRSKLRHLIIQNDILEN